LLEVAEEHLNGPAPAIAFNDLTSRTSAVRTEEDAQGQLATWHFDDDDFEQGFASGAVPARHQLFVLHLLELAIESERHGKPGHLLVSGKLLGIGQADVTGEKTARGRRAVLARARTLQRGIGAHGAREDDTWRQVTQHLPAGIGGVGDQLHGLVGQPAPHLLHQLACQLCLLQVLASCLLAVGLGAEETEEDGQRPDSPREGHGHQYGQYHPDMAEGEQAPFPGGAHGVDMYSQTEHLGTLVGAQGVIEHQAQRPRRERHQLEQQQASYLVQAPAGA